MQEEGWEIDPEDLAHISPYLTEHIRRFAAMQARLDAGWEPCTPFPRLVRASQGPGPRVPLLHVRVSHE